MAIIYILLVILATFFAIVGLLVLGFIFLLRRGNSDPPSIRPPG